MSDNPPQQPDAAIEAIREEIDRIDETILGLVGERLRVAERLTALKAPTPGLPLRPGRETKLLRRLVAAAHAPLDRDLVVELWRAIMSASLRRQRVIDVYVGGGRADPTRMYDLARRHFGARTRIQHVGEPQAALQRVAEKPNESVAVTPWPAAPSVGSWWPALSESRYHALRLVTALPVAGPTAEEPVAAVFACSANEQAGEDVSLILAEDPHHKLQRALREVGLEGREIGRTEPKVLIRVEGFLAHDDHRAAALDGHGLDRVRILGSYARV